ncbi:MAG: type II toxin-antitoxin system HigB family toxin [Halochromatium sp.]|nr:type II toxin-antitoxin system HigB family toxin [Halochromatium sp.]
MKVVGRDRLEAFWSRHAAAKGALETWFDEAKKATWAKPQDIKDRYRSASFLADNRVIFNIRGNRYRLVVKVRYRNGIVLIEWVGTHAQYDKQRF